MPALRRREVAPDASPVDLKRIERSALTRIKKAKTQNDVALLRAEVLGKKGPLGELLRGLGKLSASERPKVGAEINLLKARLTEAVDALAARLAAAEREATIEASRYDVTLPGRRAVFGARHPLRIVEDEIIAALTPLGFSVAYGPLAEHDWYNFEALNFPPDHPARDTQDTFFLGPRTLLRTHTSNVQIRTMVKEKPPVRVLAPGMVFRHDELDPTHSPVFHQIEGLWVDDHTTFAELKGTLYRFLQTLFGPHTRLRFRPSFFPFTEPSAEVDVSCIVCGGKGCRVCKSSGWIEILGAGMVHPAVFEAVGYDPDQVQGFAFGVGIERVAILKWGIEDIRLFFDNDLRFLEQFSGKAP